MENITLLTQPTQAQINRKPIFHFPVRGLQIGKNIVRSHNVPQDMSDQQLIGQSHLYELHEFTSQQLRRLAEFFTATQVDRSAVACGDRQLISYVQGWSSNMVTTNLRNTGMEHVGSRNTAAGCAYGVVQFNALHNIRGALKHTILGIGAGNGLTIPSSGGELSVMSMSDAQRVFGGNRLNQLRKP